MRSRAPGTTRRGTVRPPRTSRGLVPGVDAAEHLIGQFVGAQIEDDIQHPFGCQLFHRDAARAITVEAEDLISSLLEPGLDRHGRGRGVAVDRNTHPGPRRRLRRHRRPCRGHADDATDGVGQNELCQGIQSEDVDDRVHDREVARARIDSERRASRGDGGHQHLGHADRQRPHRRAAHFGSLRPPQSDHPGDAPFSVERLQDLRRARRHGANPAIPRLLLRHPRCEILPAFADLGRDRVRCDGGNRCGRIRVRRDARVDDKRLVTARFDPIDHEGRFGALRIKCCDHNNRRCVHVGRVLNFRTLSRHVPRGTPLVSARCTYALPVQDLESLNSIVVAAEASDPALTSRTEET